MTDDTFPPESEIGSDMGSGSDSGYGSGSTDEPEFDSGRPFDVVEIFRRAFRLVRSHRALWLFGALLALTGGSGGSGQYNTSGPDIDLPDSSDGSSSSGTLPEGIEDLSESWGGGDWGNSIWDGLGDIGSSFSEAVPWIVLVCGLVLLLVLVGVVVHYVSRVALMSMVDLIEQGANPGWRDGFRLGWSPEALRLWWLELLVLFGWLLAFAFLALVFGLPLLWILGSTGGGTGAWIVLLIIGALVVFPVLLIAGIVMSILSQLWSREIAIGGHRIEQALRRSWHRLRRDWRDVGLLWLATLVVGFAGGIGMAVLVAMVAIPVVGILFAVMAMTSSVPATIAVGIPVVTLAIVPLAFAGGLLEAFKNTAWTLGWMDLDAAG